MKSTKILALLLVVVMCLSMFASCGLFNKCDHVDANDDAKCDKCGADFEDGKDVEDGPSGDDVTTFVPKQAEYNTTTGVMPSNWNELTYTDNNDTQILSYLTSNFFEYDYSFEGGKFNADGSINAEGIIEGAYSVNYSAATKLEDVTSSVDAKWGYTDKQKAEGGYAWKITLRDDLKWDDGTAITAADFVYSMKAMLDPTFMNYRANTYYDTLMIKNSKNYFYQNQEGVYNPVKSLGYASNAAAREAGKTLYVKPSELFSGIDTFVDANGVPMPEWITGDTVYADPSSWAKGPEAAAEEGLTAAWIFGTYEAAYLDVGCSYETAVAIFVVNEVRHVDWEDVGIYSEGNSIILCLDKAYSLLKEDGSLALWAAYYMSSLPLVHEAKYEDNKHEPAAGATLWTSTYNSSLDSSASWGPYMLTVFEDGSHYKLEKNPNWYGWNMEQYKNQYNITAINCRKVEEFNTIWLGFLAGDYDDASLQTENYADYKDSKYVSYSSTTGTFGMQLYSYLPTLKASNNNNGILAIQEFRQAFNLALNRTDVIEKIWPGTCIPCYGLLNSMYFYDVENSSTLADGGIYRSTIQAMKGILRAYGFTEDANGLWSNGTLNGYSLEDAYDALTGFNMTLAKQKLAEAIAILEADPEYYGYDATKDITIIYGSSQDSDKQKFRCTYLQGVLNELTAGSKLEGKIKLVFDASAGSGWSDAFRNGDTQIGFGYGFTGNAFNPFDIIGAFVNPDDDLNYHGYWDTGAIDMTLELPAGDYDGAGQTVTMSMQNWFFCLNGLAESEKQKYTYNLGEGFAPTEVRLTILAALEEIVLKESRSVVLIADAGGSFLGAKFSYVNYDYNTFMGYGGIRYMVVEYTDAEWEAYVEANGNNLENEYKKSE